MSNEPCKRQQQKRTVDSQQAFLLAFADTGCVTRSAKAAGIARKTHYEWLKTDSDYAASFEQSKRAAGDFKGVDVESLKYGAVWRNDEKLLMRLLRRLKPAVYGGRWAS